MEEFWVNKIKIPKVALRKGESVSFGGGEMVFDLNQHTKEEFDLLIKVRELSYRHSSVIKKEE